MADIVQTLVDHVIRGELLDLADGADIDEAAMRAWGPEHTVPATVIRDILRGRLAPGPDPHGLRLRAARIEGRIDAENLTTDVALELHDCLLTEGMVARDAHLACLVLNGCLLEHPHEPPLDATRLVTETRVELKRAMATSAHTGGTVRLLGAHIGGLLRCSGARLRNDTGPALYASGLQVDQSAFLDEGFEAVGSGENGAVLLPGAYIGGQLVCRGARLRNGTGPALYGSTLQVGRSAFLDEGFEAVGSGENGAVLLPGAYIGGQLRCSGARLRNDTGPALYASGLQVDQSAFLDEGFEAVGSSQAGTVRLSGARISGALVFAPARLENPDPSGRLVVDGLTYAGLPTRNWRVWLELLSKATPSYAAQPYQHLAAAHRAAGHDGDTREVLIAQRHDQLRRAATGHRERAWGRLTWITLGYGYQSWRALLGLLVVVAVAVLLTAVGPGAHGGLTDAKETATRSQGVMAARCSTVDRIGVGLDFGLPLIKIGDRSQCETSDTAAGQVLIAVGWALQACAWAFATLFIAGFTSVVRKT